MGVAVVAVRMVQMVLHQVVGVIVVWDTIVPATRAVLMICRVLSFVLGGVLVRISIAHC
jgi:hypothetical protein